MILFPEKIGGRFAPLRRPLRFVNPDHSSIQSIDAPGIWICFSDDLATWPEPELLIKPEYEREGDRIGGATPPIKTDEGWLVFCHGVETQHPPMQTTPHSLLPGMHTVYLV